MTQSSPAPVSHACGCHGCGASAPEPARTPQSPGGGAVLGRWRRRDLVLPVCVALLAAAQVWTWAFPSAPAWAMLPALAVGGVPVAVRAVAAARRGVPFSIEMLMSIAVLGALVLGAWDEAAVVVVLFLLGEALEGVAARRAQAGIRALTELLPETARRRRGETWEEVAARSLRADDVVQVRPGDRLPVDGVVLAGFGGVDEAALSGESVPVFKRAGDKAFAGTVCLDGVLEMRATANADDTSLARVARLVEQAQRAKAPVARFIERFARWYTPMVVGLAVLVMVVPPVLLGQDWHAWVYRGLALLLIGCPCALVISTPAAIAAALAAGARNGVLIKGGAVLERLAAVDKVALDKTGTLTEGRPVVTDVLAVEAGDWLAVAAGLADGSTHPLARAVAAHAAAAGVTAAVIDGAQAVPGLGVGGRWQGRAVFLGMRPQAETQGQAWHDQARDLGADGKTVTALAVDGRVVLVFGCRDRLRDDACDGVAALRRLGVEAAVLSGDAAAAAAQVGRQLGVDVHAPLLPADKLALIRQWQDGGAVVAKVGDGINDAPALAQADVGIAMGGGSDIALETADAALLHGRVGDVAAALRLARRGMATIRQNVALALGLKGVFLLTTLVGLTGLWPAVLADTGATVLVTANALRLLRGKPARS